MQDRIDEFHRLGANVYGLTVDSHHVLKAWSESLNLTYPLLSDFNREAMTALGVKFDDFGGYHGVSRRAVFIIDRDGTIAYADILDQGGMPDLDPVFERLGAIPG